MKRIVSVVSLALIAALAHANAWAIDVPVNYWVDGKVLKEATVATLAEFELYQDPLCTKLAYSDTGPRAGRAAGHRVLRCRGFWDDLWSAANFTYSAADISK